MQQARVLHQTTGKAARVFTEFTYQTRKSWSRARRVVAKAEYLDKGENPRFVVTSLTPDKWPDQDLYERFYCASGEMENRIKEQMCLFADRLSTDEMKGNQLRLYFSALAYTLIEALRRLGLEGTEWAQAQVDTIRLKLFKIGASSASACAASSSNSVQPIPGKISSRTPTTPCDAEPPHGCCPTQLPSGSISSAWRSYAQNTRRNPPNCHSHVRNRPGTHILHQPVPKIASIDSPTTQTCHRIRAREKCGLVAFRLEVQSKRHRNGDRATTAAEHEQ